MNQLSSLLLVLFIGYFSISQAQNPNLVPNPSFEIITGCPSGNSQYHNATPWLKPMQSITTPDLFSTCFASAGTGCNSVSVPSNFGGIAAPRTGNNYMGMITKYGNNLREYLTVQLSSPLLAGETYDVGAYIMLAPFARYANNHFGIHVSASQLSQTTGCCNNGVINVNPSVEGSNVVSNRSSWTLISGSYTATGGERFITLGNFKPDNQNTITDFGSMGGGCALVTAGAYYYVEDVFLRVSGPLAIEGLDLSAQANLDRTASLNWTLAEHAAYTSFSLEKSADGNSFTSLLTDLPPASGSYIDESPFPGESFYRMRAIDLNGEVHYSAIQTVRFEEELTFSVQAFPNPFSEQLSVEIQTEVSSSHFVIELKDCFGRSLLTKSLDVDGGSERIDLHEIATLSAGMYILSISNGSEQIVKKLHHL